MMLATQMMHRYSLSVRSVVSVCLRLVRPSVPVLGQFSYARQYSNGAQSSARATASQVSVLQDDSNDMTPVDTKTQASKPVSGLNYNRPKYYWTKKQAAMLNEGAELRCTSGWTWNKVAEHVGGGIPAAQCRLKWQSLNVHSRTLAEWDDKELELLSELVAKYTNPETRRVTWKQLSTVLNRPASQIKNKWGSVISHKAVRFTPELDALIQKRVAAWGVKTGLWASLHRELGFRATTIRTRYYRLVAGTSNMVYFTPEMDQVIIDDRTAKKPGKRMQRGDWNSIAARVGPNVTPAQCKARWVSYLRHKARGLRVGVEFTATELARITEFAMEHAALNKIPWTKLGKELNVMPRECQDKWRDLRQRHMKKGHFSAEEDALLQQRVKEWGDPRLRKGLWAALTNELNRPADSLLQRWNWLCIVAKEGGKK